ncbi:dihydrodipicolinate synthase/N-acetylneuraminate lyase [Silvibacterium bohemicum]|uniref:Dihydrodipicolinate synthase/N-acetylneuraminate lyase n=1 Tax=Silvibacterium bohemicum TaxID=1577686 RepID=A0A841JSE8_9BACT|nr:dihydrodipicolinate synthase family protein [Silvibacterium bohemicum]MBB6143437.1 dihydrodipicolinate synthase/N-acetylneuraminate lyase [Silvibacterium bohemicum]
MLLEGIFTAATTPFDADGRIYWTKLEQNIDHYSRTPVSGLVLLGSTGEAVMLSDEESRRVLRAAREAASAEKVLLAGVARESFIETLRLAEFAAEHQYDAVLVRTPHYYSPQYGGGKSNALGILTYYRALADRSPLPVVLYSIPKFTHYDLPVEVIAELAQHPNIIGLKDSSGNVQRIADVVAATRSIPPREVPVTSTFTAFTGRMLLEVDMFPGNFVSTDVLSGGAAVAAPPAPTVKGMRKKPVGFQVLCGSAEHLLPSVEAGASGAVLALAACAPQACQEIYIAWKDNDPMLAAEKQQRVVQASRYVSGQLGIPGIKHACDLNGYYGGRPRLPLLPLNAEQQAEVARVMEDVRN